MDTSPSENWVEIYRTVDDADARLLCGLLENEGVPCRMESGKVSNFPVSFGKLGEITVFVREADVELAHRVMEAGAAPAEEGL